MADQILLFNSSQFENNAISSSLTFNGYAVIAEKYDLKRCQQLLSTAKVDVLVVELISRDNLNFARNLRSINKQVGIVFISPIHDLRLFEIQMDELPDRSQIIYKPSISNFEVILEAIVRSKDFTADKQWINPPETEKTEELPTFR